MASLYAPQGHKGVCSCESWVVEIRSLSATIMSEFANKKTRGAFIAAVFSMQGFGILAASAVTMVVCKIFDRASNVSPNGWTPDTADFGWRLILMLGAIPAAITFYWRMMMPETARYSTIYSHNLYTY